MSLRKLVLVSLWALSLVAAAQLGAAAQKPSNDPGYAVRFVQTGTHDGMLLGKLTAQVNGQWMTVEIAPPVSRPNVHPLKQ
ncbi:MAG: hypothetical protein IT184_16555 [Acidobacteria bacterium]|nr:hypothetical protein [Acidobacteriota bacterium]